MTGSPRPAATRAASRRRTTKETSVAVAIDFIPATSLSR